VPACGDAPQAATHSAGLPAVVEHNITPAGSPAVASPCDPIPSIAAIFPESATAMSGDFTLTVRGENFSSTSVISWNGNTLATRFVTASQITALIKDRDLAFAGIAEVTVTNPASSGVSRAAIFTILSPGQAFTVVHAIPISKIR